MSLEQRPHAGVLFSRLRAETNEQHTALEALVPLMSPSMSRGDYVRFLTLSWSFHSSVEQALRRVERLSAIVPDLEQRWKTPRLAQDLSALGVDTVAFLQSSNRGRSPFAPEEHATVPAIGSIERALGVMYVLEGSTLGGQYLYRHLSQVLPTLMASASSFLGCYGASTGRMWNSFRQEVEQASSGLDADAVVGAAREAFVVLMDWFGPPRREVLGGAEQAS